MLVGLTVFLGLLTQYYYVFYAFFVCAAFVFWAAAKRRWKSLGLFALCAFAGVGLLLLVFPACIQHLTADKLVSGGNALEQLSAFSQYRFRLLLFFREARHGMKAAVLCALGLVLLLLVFFRKLRAAGKEKPLPWRSLVILLPAFVPSWWWRSSPRWRSSAISTIWPPSLPPRLAFWPPCWSGPWGVLPREGSVEKAAPCWRCWPSPCSGPAAAAQVPLPRGPLLCGQLCRL